MAEPSVLLIGFGNMGQALARGWLERGRDRTTIHVVDPAAEARAVAASMDLAARSDWSQQATDILLLAIKPAQLADAARQAGPVTGVVLSIVAGKTLAQLESLFGNDVPIVRAMPNTPAAIGRGATVLCANAVVDRSRRDACAALMSAVGHVKWVQDEALMDAVTAVSGSGPAYVFLLIECLAQAAREAGLDAELASELATQTVAGAAIYADLSELDAAELRTRVTSPNGTTQAALEVLMGKQGLQSLISAAVAAAARRSRELSNESS